MKPKFPRSSMVSLEPSRKVFIQWHVECSVLRRLYRHFRYGRGIYEDFTEKQVIQRYLENYLELYEKDRFAGIQKQSVNRDQLIGLQSE